LALAGLQENVISPEKTFFCNGSFELGSQTFHCHERKGHGTVNLTTALMMSCDVYFYQTGIALGVDRIARYARSLGLGERLGLGLNLERPGLIPTTQWKRDTFKSAWTLGETPSISIGQGANLLTPLQMVSLYSTIANGGKIWKPHLISRVMNPRGKILFEAKPELLKEASDISPKNFEIVRSALEQVVMNDRGTGKRARVPDISVAGKSGSVQVVSLKKNRNQTNVAMKWKEHAIFVAFSPTEKAEVAVIVVSDNDSVGGGGASAAPVAGKILDAYWKSQKKERKTISTTEVKDAAR
jgi:penicillin-binding protein 2